MRTLGRHLLLELNDCDRDLLNNIEFLRTALLDAAVKCGATVLGESFHQFSPQGVSGVVTIAESHISIHTWPEHGYAAVDVFTCGTRVDPEKAAEVLSRAMKSRNHSTMEIARGVVNE